MPWIVPDITETNPNFEIMNSTRLWLLQTHVKKTSAQFVLTRNFHAPTPVRDELSLREIRISVQARHRVCVVHDLTIRRESHALISWEVSLPHDSIFIGPDKGLGRRRQLEALFPGGTYTSLESKCCCVCFIIFGLKVFFHAPSETRSKSALDVGEIPCSLCVFHSRRRSLWSLEEFLFISFHLIF